MNLMILATCTGLHQGGLIAEHDALRRAIGSAPSVYACYRFAAKLREHKPPSTLAWPA
jgi:hypothetical protein